jgi:hypothetical protein
MVGAVVSADGVGLETVTEKVAVLRSKVPPVLLLTSFRVIFAVPGLTPVTVTEGVSPQEPKVSCEGLTVATAVLLLVTFTFRFSEPWMLQPFSGSGAFRG